MGNIIEEFDESEQALEFIQEDAILFIHEQTGIDKEVIDQVLKTELDYMISLGIFVPAEESEEA